MNTTGLCSNSSCMTYHPIETITEGGHILSEKDFKGWVDFDWFIEFGQPFEFYRAIDAWNDKNPNIAETWGSMAGRYRSIFYDTKGR